MTDPTPDLSALFALGWSAQPEIQHLGKQDDDEEDDDLEIEDDEDSDDDEDDEDSDDDEDDEPLREAGKKALLKERARRKEAERKLREASKPKPKRKADDDDDEDDADERVAAATKAGNLRFVRSEARSALKDAGLAEGVSVARAIRMIESELADLEIDDDDEVDGLAEVIADLKEENPGLFAKTTQRRRRTGSAGTGRDGDGPGSGKKPLSASERQAAALVAASKRRS